MQQIELKVFTLLLTAITDWGEKLVIHDFSLLYPLHHPRYKLLQDEKYYVMFKVRYKVGSWKEKSGIEFTTLLLELCNIASCLKGSQKLVFASLKAICNRTHSPNQINILLKHKISYLRLKFWVSLSGNIVHQVGSQKWYI